MKSAIERAFAIASGGQFRRMDYLQKQLAEEGYDPAALIGRQLSKQIHALAREAKGKIAEEACQLVAQDCTRQKAGSEPPTSA